ncbi:glycoside hydrolase family 28 protein [Piloderma croceum F 1598]|uniref:endo-polygalacturonase n=1 Tax=Piloderma croceum (strain F 1598) TaxID=765440 RepID=A0A0C3F2L2_PILCF|nr:glycoside hydrolase family 28 protein [Piloderma croceum F 1598]
MTAGKTLSLTGLASGTTVNLLSEVTFGVQHWAGPLFEIGTSSSTGTFIFNGDGKTLNRQGASYWDGKGTSGGVTKPHPMVHITNAGGSFKNVTVLNSPAHAISVSNTAPITITGVTSVGMSLACNTDCFDVAASSVTITGNACRNQDDCMAVNAGSNIKLLSNTCTGGHGISIGSIASGSKVNKNMISGNNVTDSMYGLRIKTVYGATNASVADVIYSGNRVSGITYQGVAIEQDYKVRVTMFMCIR